MVRATDAGVSPSGKAAGFDPAIRRFESFHPSQFLRPGAPEGTRPHAGPVDRARSAAVMSTTDKRTSDTIALFAGNAIPALAQDIAKGTLPPAGHNYVERC